MSVLEDLNITKEVMCVVICVFVKREMYFNVYSL